MAGWGGEVFRAGNGWWWIPLVGPMAGGLLGGLVYDRLIGRRHPRG
jgi:glycerol uptake facilitator-like aquaporin